MTTVNTTVGAPVSLTVVIPHYNHIGLLPRAIASVLDQDLPSVEILLVDDGSEQSCQGLLDWLEQTVPEVRVVRHVSNQGAPAALNTGLAHARGKMISFLGADDLALPGLYAGMAATLEAHPDVALACGEIAIISDDNSLRGIRPMMAPAMRKQCLTPAMVRRRSLTTDNWICNTATVYRTRFVRDAGGFDISLGAFCDGFLVRQLAFETGFVFVPGVVGVWRVDAATLSATTALQVERSKRMNALFLERMARSRVAELAPEYLATLARRVRFSAARLQFVWKGRSVDPADVCQIAGLGAADLKMLRGVQHVIGFGAVGSRLALGWLAVRMRPYGMMQFLTNMIRNRFVLWRSGDNVRQSLQRIETIGRRLTQDEKAG